MKPKITLIVRILLGFIFFASGIAGLFHLAPVPPDLPEALVTYNKGLEASIYFMPFLKLTETICGLLLLSGFFVPLALVVLAPITLNIILVHSFMAPSGVPLAVIVNLMLLYLAFFSHYNVVIKQLFKPKV